MKKVNNCQNLQENIKLAHKTTKVYLSILQDMNNDERYKDQPCMILLDSTTDAILELYRYVLLSSFGDTYIIADCFSCLESIIPHLKEGLKPYTNSLSDTSSRTKNLFIQACLLHLSKSQDRTEVCFNCKPYNN